MAKVKPISESNDSSTTITVNNQKYEFEAVLANTQSAIPLPVGVIQQLVIKDSLYSPFVSAEIVIDNTNNPIDNFVTKTTNELKEVEKIGASYTFNYDSLDIIYLKLTPINFKRPGDKDIFKIEYAFIIEDEDEEIVKEGNQKRKILYLKDARQHYLESVNIRWSTADALLRSVKKEGFDIRVAQAGNTGREIESGLAIRDFLTQVFEDTFKPTFNEIWPTGGTSHFYSSLNTTTGMDDLEYLLDNHISDPPYYDRGILKLNKNNTWSLFSLRDLFRMVVGETKDSYGFGLSDIFHISGKQILANNSKIPQKSGPASVDKNLTQKFPGLETYNFLNTTSKDTSKEFVSTMVHNYDSFYKQFSIDGENTHIDKLQEEFQRLYVDNMKGENPTAIFPTNEIKKENTIVNHIYSGGSDQKDRRIDGINRVLSKAVTLAPGINFTTEGSTHRETGKFVALFNDNVDQYSAADKLLVGDWLITNINHVFLLNQNQYLNDITCVKPYTSIPLVEDEQST